MVLSRISGIKGILGISLFCILQLYFFLLNGKIAVTVFLSPLFNSSLLFSLLCKMVIRGSSDHICREVLSSCCVQAGEKPYLFLLHVLIVGLSPFASMARSSRSLFRAGEAKGTSLPEPGTVWLTGTYRPSCPQFCWEPFYMWI